MPAGSGNTGPKGKVGSLGAILAKVHSRVTRRSPSIIRTLVFIANCLSFIRVMDTGVVERKEERLRFGIKGRGVGGVRVGVAKWGPDFGATKGGSQQTNLNRKVKKTISIFSYLV